MIYLPTNYMQPIETTLTDTSPDSVSFKKALKAVLGATAGRFGNEFHQALLKELSHSLNLDSLLIGRIENPKTDQIRSLAVFSNEQIRHNFNYQLSLSPCQKTLIEGIYYIPNNVKQHYPNNEALLHSNLQGYLGVTLNNSKNQPIGVLACYFQQPIEQLSLAISILQVFAYRIAAELERQLITQNLLNEINVNQTQIDAVPALMFMLNHKGQFLRWNKYFRSKFGYTHKQMQLLSVINAVHSDDRLRVTAEIETIFSQGSGTFYLNGLTCHNQAVPLLVNAQTTQYEEIEVIVGVALDMSEQQKTERNLLRSQGRLARKNSQLSLINTLVEKLHSNHNIKHIAQEVVNLLKDIDQGASLIFTVIDQSDQDLQIIDSNGFSQQLLNARQTFSLSQPGSPTNIAITSQQLEIFPDIITDDRIDPAIRKLIQQEGIVGGLVIPLIYQGKALGGITVGFKYVSGFPEDEIEFYRTIGSSISLALANARQYSIVETLATHDNLTGLPNRNALNQDSLTALKQVANQHNHLGLILVDLDRFKEINDTLDHQIGDKLLKLIGPRIRAALNNQLIPIYRIGGDEFCILLTHQPSSESIEMVAEQVKQAILQVFVVDGLNLEISSSIGVLTTQGSQHSAKEMLRCAELAMYHAKNSGGGIALYSPELDENTHQRFVIMAEMAEAIRNNELVLHYQPKIDLKTRQIVGCEALVRWQHKKYGLLPPIKFIPLIELTQLIHPLTRWVMNTAMQQIEQWKQQNISISVAINLSTRNLTDSNFIEQLDTLMQTYGIEANELEFEVTETALMSNLNRAMQQLNEFKNRGIQCSLDDYGTGYSSLSYIKKLPLDTLKIDRSFISLMLQDKADKTIAQSTINLAHDLNMKVVAEGVEDEQTLQELASQGCDMVQGYFTGKPVDAETFANNYWRYTQSPPVSV